MKVFATNKREYYAGAVRVSDSLKNRLFCIYVSNMNIDDEREKYNKMKDQSHLPPSLRENSRRWVPAFIAGAAIVGLILIPMGLVIAKIIRDGGL